MIISPEPDLHLPALDQQLLFYCLLDTREHGA